MIGKTALHWLLYRLGLHLPHSQTTEKERNLITKYADGKTTAVEIGVYEGRTTAVIAGSIAKNGKVFAIDPFFSGRLGIPYGKMIAHHYLRRKGLTGKIHFLEMLSHEAVALLKEDIDFLFIDGDHSYEGITRDWEDWAGKIRPGGIAALHDTSVPDHDPSVASLGSYRYFQNQIIHDDRFQWLETVDSLNILQRKSAP